MSFPARYTGSCPACDERIREGDLVRFAPEARYVIHDDCDSIDVKDRDPLAASHAVCPSCSLTHPEGACDR